MSSQQPYRGLSRAYRPQIFSDVCDQNSIITTLKNALRLGKTAQAYLFCGTRGTGKTTLARLLAKALNCQQPTQEIEPCNKCLSCQEITQGKNLDVLEIDGASHRGIDDIRGLQESLVYAPSSYRYKVFIIDEAHMLTKEAFNALLKVLEEPPSHIKFLLATTEPHKIPLTIISRCQRFDLQRISLSSIQKKLSAILQDLTLTGNEEALYRLAEISDGSLRVAESLLDQVLCFLEEPLTSEGVERALALCPQEDFFCLDQAFQTYDLPFAFRWAHTLFSSGKDLTYFLDRLLDHYRNILAVHMQVSLEDLPPSLREKYQHAASIYTEEQAFYLLDYLISQHAQIQKISSKRIALEALFLHIIKSRHRICASDLVQRLLTLQPTPSLKQESLQRESPMPAASLQETTIPSTKTPSVHYDTLLRFASVELEGSVKRHTN